MCYIPKYSVYWNRCGYECKPDRIVDKERRESLLAKAKTETEKKKAKNHSVRGLRRCTNAKCACYLSRDYNAANGIGLRYKEIYAETYIDTRDEEDKSFEHYNCIICEDDSI